VSAVRKASPPLGRWFIVAIVLGTAAVIAVLLSVLWMMRAAGGAP